MGKWSNSPSWDGRNYSLSTKSPSECLEELLSILDEEASLNSTRDGLWWHSDVPLQPPVGTDRHFHCFWECDCRPAEGLPGLERGASPKDTTPSQTSQHPVTDQSSSLAPAQNNPEWPSQLYSASRHLSWGCLRAQLCPLPKPPFPALPFPFLSQVLVPTALSN